MPAPNFSAAYRVYVKDNNDLIGIIAYGLYKEQKQSYFNDLHTKGGREITAADVDAYHSTMCTTGTVEAYRANTLVVYNKLFQSKLSEVQQSFADEFKKNEIMLKLDGIQNAIQEKTTFLGWVKGVAETLLVNVLTIFVLGALILGYSALKSGNIHLDHLFGVESTAPGGAVPGTTVPTPPAGASSSNAAR